MGQSKIGIHETCVVHVSGPTAKWKVILANSSYGGALLVAVSKMGTRMVRHYDQDERQSDAALHGDTKRQVLLKAFKKTWSTRFLREALVSIFS